MVAFVLIFRLLDISVTLVSPIPQTIPVPKRRALKYTFDIFIIIIILRLVVIRAVWRIDFDLC